MAKKLNSTEKKKKYIDYLKKVGFFINYNDLDLYHGRVRAREEKEGWQVRTDVDNSFKTTRDNIMGIPCLCVASYSVADAYAKGTSLNGRSGEMEIHKIVSFDDQSMIVNENFSLSKFSHNDLEKFFAAIQFLTGDSINKYAMTVDNSVDVLDIIIKSYKDKILLSTNDEEKIYNLLLSNGSLVSKEEVKQIVGAYNINNMFVRMPKETISDFVFSQGEKREYTRGSGELYSLNQDLIKFIMKKNNIIGIKKKNRLDIKEDIVYLFDLEKVQVATKVVKQELE